MSADGTKRRPVPVIEEDLQSALPGELARFDVENDDPRLCGQDLYEVSQDPATTYDVRGARPLTSGYLRSSASRHPFHRQSGSPHLTGIPRGCSSTF
jgi:hypothetical protein